MSEQTLILQNIEALRREMRDSAKEFNATASSIQANFQTLNATVSEKLGGINATISSIKDTLTRQERRLDLTEDAQKSCPARHGIKGANARIVKLENFKEKVQEERGEVTGITTVRTTDSTTTVAAMGFTHPITKSLFIRMLPWLAVAVLVGAALGGYMLATLLMQN